jgi:hypothetical protein
MIIIAGGLFTLAKFFACIIAHPVDDKIWHDSLVPILFAAFAIIMVCVMMGCTYSDPRTAIIQSPV